MNVKMNAKYNKDLPWQVANLKKNVVWRLIKEKDKGHLMPPNKKLKVFIK